MRIRWKNLKTNEVFEIEEYSYYFAEKKIAEIRKNKSLALIYFAKLC